MGSATILPLALVVALVVTAFAAPSSKIESKLLKRFQKEQYVPVFVNMKKGTTELLASISSTMHNSREDRINAVAQGLKHHTATTQRNLLEFLDKSGILYESFWVSNQIYIFNATYSLILQLAEFPEVAEVIEEGISYIEEPEISEVVRSPPGDIKETQWGISKIQADRVWGTAGNTGVGVIVGIIDTGARGTHRDLRANYRSPYGWRDPLDNNINAVPNDGQGHGTHCLGTIIGSNGIGVAPGAKWIACKGCTSSFCLNSHLIMCGQWMVCPTLPDGSGADCSKAPHLVSNSWAGGQGNTFYDTVINAWKAAGIVPVFAQGNSGPSCDSALSPGDSPDVIGVGATTVQDNLASFSSKGPSRRGGIKPELTAPGSEIYSSMSFADDGYGTLSGTSMAAPHVSGAIALMLSRKANMTYAEIKESLFNGAETTVLTPCETACGGIPGTTYPNNCYGHGRLNVFNSVSLISKK